MALVSKKEFAFVAVALVAAAAGIAYTLGGNPLVGAAVPVTFGVLAAFALYAGEILKSILVAVLFLPVVFPMSIYYASQSVSGTAVPAPQSALVLMVAVAALGLVSHALRPRSPWRIYAAALTGLFAVGGLIVYYVPFLGFYAAYLGAVAAGAVAYTFENRRNRAAKTDAAPKPETDKALREATQELREMSRETFISCSDILNRLPPGYHVYSGYAAKKEPDVVWPHVVTGPTGCFIISGVNDSENNLRNTNTALLGKHVYGLLMARRLLAKVCRMNSFDFVNILAVEGPTDAETTRLSASQAGLSLGEVTVMNLDMVYPFIVGHHQISAGKSKKNIKKVHKALTLPPATFEETGMELFRLRDSRENTTVPDMSEQSPEASVQEGAAEPIDLEWLKSGVQCTVLTSDAVYTGWTVISEPYVGSDGAKVVKVAEPAANLTTDGGLAGEARVLEVPVTHLTPET